MIKETNKMEERDVEVIEVDMTSEEINEMMGKLNELLESRGNTRIEISDDVDLSINYVQERLEDGE